MNAIQINSRYGESISLLLSVDAIELGLRWLHDRGSSRCVCGRIMRRAMTTNRYENNVEYLEAAYDCELCEP